jgi:diguanylate cyclase
MLRSSPVPSDEALFDQLSTTLLQAVDLEGLVRPLLKLLQTITGLESTYFTSIDPARQTQTVLYATNTDQLRIPEGAQVDWQDTLCKRALEQDRLVNNAVSKTWGDSAAARVLGIETYASAPIHVAGGELFGTLCAAGRQAVELSPKALQSIKLFASIIARQIERERLIALLQQENARLSHANLLDPLTGLLNRRGLEEHLPRLLAQAERQQRRVMLAFIDLDGFKQINDDHGHPAGDAFLRQVGQRLKNGLRASDVLARYGGDEFVVAICVDPEAVRHESALRERLFDLTRGQYTLEQGHLDYPGPSIGIAVCQPGSADMEGLLKRADQAMYAQKLRRRQQPRPQHEP